MRKALVLFHVAFEDAGSLGPALEAAGFAIDQVEASTADLAALDPLAPDLLVVMGGPLGAYEGATYPCIDAGIALLRRRLAAGLPTLGICLGAQLMAAALGARVHPGHGKEIGWSVLAAGDDAAAHPAFAELLLPPVPVLHWHGDTFELPPGAQHLASTPAYRNQAFALGPKVLGLQFHPEVQAGALERWYVGHACELAGAGIDVNALREAGRGHAPALEAAAGRFWRRWLDGAFPA